MNDAFAYPTSETSLAWLVLLVIGGLAGWRWLAWWFRAPAQPDPWETELATPCDPDAAQPLCLRCLEPHPQRAWFCPHCGTPVGDFNNYNPYLYVFSLGELLRTGTSGRFRRNWLTLAGFVFVGALEYLIFAPLYWFLLALNLRRQSSAAPPASQTPHGLPVPPADPPPSPA